MPDTMSTREDPANRPHRRPEGPLKLRDEEADRKGIAWYVKSATIGPRDGHGRPYFLVSDHGGVGEREAGTPRYWVTPLDGAAALGKVDAQGFDTWHDATEAALKAAEALHEYARAESQAQMHRSQARQALGLDKPLAEASAT